MHTVAILALHDFIPFDLGIPCEVFGFVRLLNGEMGYCVKVCGEAEYVNTGAFTLQAHLGLDHLIDADTIIIPGIKDPKQPLNPKVKTAILKAWQKGARIASICSGAFVLAETGLLDGYRATTHWMLAEELATRYPKIKVDPKVLFVDEERLITSAGASSGLDMCLHLVRRDYGQSVAAQAAKLAVAPLNRDGGQAQFIQYEIPETRDSLATLLECMNTHLDDEIDIKLLACKANMSPRTFARRFREQIGTTPLQWLLTMRIQRAQELLETSSQSIEEIALCCGFNSPVTFRTRFKNSVGVSPSAYRAKFISYLSS